VLSNELRRIQGACPSDTPSKQIRGFVSPLCYNYTNRTKGKLKMGNIAEIIAVACDECGGAGFLFWGDENNYDVEACECALDDWNI
jgi:hypothetical protein